MITPPLFNVAALVIGAFPLVWQDAKRMSVSQSLLWTVFAFWVVVGGWDESTRMSSAALSAGVLTVGAGYLLLAPEALGEADVLFMAGMAWLLPFWSLLLALTLACIFGFTAFLWASGFGQRSISGIPLPYLPCLALGGFAVLGGSL